MVRPPGFLLGEESPVQYRDAEAHELVEALAAGEDLTEEALTEFLSR